MIKKCKIDLNEGLYIDGKFYAKGVHDDLELNIRDIEHVMYYGKGNTVFEIVDTPAGKKYIALSRHNYKDVAHVDIPVTKPVPAPTAPVVEDVKPVQTEEEKEPIKTEEVEDKVAPLSVDETVNTKFTKNKRK